MTPKHLARMTAQYNQHEESFGVDREVTATDNYMNPKKRSRRRRRKNGSNKNAASTTITSMSSNDNTYNNGYVSESSSTSLSTSGKTAQQLSSPASSIATKITSQKKKSKSRTASTAISIEEQQQYVALDCEMVGVAGNATSGDYERSILARVTIVNWTGDTIYDKLVRPTEPVINYRTFVSGISAADFEENDDDHNDRVVDFDICRTQVLEIIQNKVIVGHGLKNDLVALQIHHPWQLIRDTAKYEPFMKQRYTTDTTLWPRKLKELVYEYCHQMIIQPYNVPHSSYEDAYAAMILYQTVRTKWEKVMTYKIQKTAEIEQLRRKLQQHPIDIVDIVPPDNRTKDDTSNVSLSSSFSSCDEIKEGDDDEEEINLLPTKTEEWPQLVPA